MAGVRFHTSDSAPAVGPNCASRATARSLSPPPHSEPWPIIMMCAERLAMAPTIGRLPISRSYRSARLGSSRNAGPFALGFWIRPFTRTYSSTKPVRIGKAPVPMMECPVGVFDGDAPTVTWVNHAPCARSDRR